MKTWDDIKFLYLSIAQKYVRRFTRFEIDELVNEAWIMTYPFINVSDYKLPHKIHQVIIDYIRRNLSWRYREKYKYRMITVSSLGIVPDKFEADNKDFECVDCADYIAETGRRLSFSEKMAIILKYDYDAPVKRIGKCMNCSGENARLIINRGLRKMKGSTV